MLGDASPVKTQSDNKKTEYRLSLKVKWALGTALGALLIFAGLTFVLFQTFTQDLLKQERQNVNQSLVAVNQRLNGKRTELTRSQLNQAIRPEDLLQKADRAPSKIYSASITRGLSSSEMVVQVFNLKGQVLFSTGKQTSDFKVSSARKIRLVPGKTHKILLGSMPIISTKSHRTIGYLQVENKLTNYYQSFNRLLVISGLVLILVVIASGLLGYVLSYFLLRPIDDIHDTLTAIRDDPTASQRVPKLKRHDELSDLGEMFNEMLDRMQRYIEQQSQFVEDVSHELRTPVAIIQGHMEMLNRWGKDDPKILAESLSASLKETKRMQDLVQEMLDLSRAEQVEINFRDEKTDVDEVVHQVFNNFQMIHPDFTFVLDDDLKEKVIVPIYRDHFEQVLIILCDNAVKYSTKRKEIHISLSRTLNEVEVGVQDFGEGISQADMNKVFNRFYRVDKARSRKKGGNGLGLSIAKRLVEGYHGDITLESSAGYGSLFRITLPVIDADVKSLDD
ncbi:Two-component system histidine kinase [Paucilactobacillus wasatchensis]|uniref:Signal transduction histidine-protein kinase ArlS n=1 Tax=Paucilactobacillus wasatchensis TaxID=1335616 RepID=A0A0D1ABQ8_9LACO|nr:Two-component system histidine kinase [Paucilactobacillus wasatchensis]